MPATRTPRPPKVAPPPPGWRSRIVGEGEEPPDQLLANPQNWRVHPADQQAALGEALERVGWVQRVVVNVRRGAAWSPQDRNVATVVDGHLRVMLALRREEARIPVVYVDLDPDEEAYVLATLDPIAALAVADREKLGPLIDGVLAGAGGAITAVMEALAVREGLDAHTRPDVAGIVDAFAHNIGQSEKNEQWFYVEYYGDSEQFVQLQTLLRRAGVLAGDHQVDGDAFAAAITQVYRTD